MGLSREDALAILEDHNARTAHFGEMEDADIAATGYNPVCGDRYRVFMRIDGERIRSVRFHGFGCVLSRASASMMARTLEGEERQEAEGRIAGVRHALLGDAPLPTVVDPDIQALAGVQSHSTRLKCVLLPWQAASAALAGKQLVTTE